MSTNRFHFQVYIETVLGCFDPEKWENYKKNLENHVLSEEQAETAKRYLREDAADLYYKAMLSLCKGLNSLSRGYHSWSVVNLYYSSFYCMRSHLAAIGTGITKNKGVYYWTATSGLKPVKIDVGKVRGDHQAILAAFRKFVKEDILETNTVDGKNVYK